MVGEVELEARDARERACRRPDLGREVGERREVVARERRLRREPAAGELHPVAGIPGEPDHDGVELDNGLAHETGADTSSAGGGTDTGLPPINAAP